MAHIPKIVLAANRPRVILTCYLKCAGPFVRKVSMLIQTLANVKCVLLSSDAQLVHTIPVTLLHIALVVNMAHSTKHQLLPVRLAVIPINIKILGIILVMLVKHHA